MAVKFSRSCEPEWDIETIAEAQIHYFGFGSAF